MFGLRVFHLLGLLLYHKSTSFTLPQTLEFHFFLLGLSSLPFQKVSNYVISLQASLLVRRFSFRIYPHPISPCLTSCSRSLSSLLLISKAGCPRPKILLCFPGQTCTAVSTHFQAKLPIRESHLFTPSV